MRLWHTMLFTPKVCMKKKSHCSYLEVQIILYNIKYLEPTSKSKYSCEKETKKMLQEIVQKLENLKCNSVSFEEKNSSCVKTKVLKSICKTNTFTNISTVRIITKDDRTYNIIRKTLKQK